jgi:hypothetical protein
MGFLFHGNTLFRSRACRPAVVEPRLALWIDLREDLGEAYPPSVVNAEVGQWFHFGARR